jgi:energy-coupling factor transporter ATP-binding protein EcfA2
MSVRYQDTNPFPRGSEWRKWDLHVHAPGGKLNDNYGDTDEVWAEFCQILVDSDVEVIGVTDYFSLTNFFRAKKRFGELQPASRKVLLPNLELRLSDSVNKDGEQVELHVILRPDLTEQRAATLLTHLQTQSTEEGSKRSVPASELETTKQFEAATVTRDVLHAALANTFGPDQAEDPSDYLLVVPANHGGLRCDLGEKRKVEIAARIDEETHAVFGSEKNVEFFGNERVRGQTHLPPKPVLAGSDAHSLQDLRAWLGREVVDDRNQKTVTWIKADPNFEGLLQIRAEPLGRVRLGAPRPDAKDPYRVIDSVGFSQSDVFPDRIDLNPNLVAVIGPRSSGKSSLLAHIAYAIDPKYTVRRQEEVEPRPEHPGPAPGVSWTDTAPLDVDVQWRQPDTTEGKVIYVPQNALYSISQKAEQIAERIEPALRDGDPDFDTAMRQMASAVGSANEEIELGVADWFQTATKIEAAVLGLRDRGDKEAIEATRRDLGERIALKRNEAHLSDDEAKEYESVMDRVAAIDARSAVIGGESHQLSAYLDGEGATLAANPDPKVEVRITPSPSGLPESLRETMIEIAQGGEAEIVAKVAAALVDYQRGLTDETEVLAAERLKLQEDNKELIERNEANSEIDELTKSRRRQDELIEQIAADEKRITGLRGESLGVGSRLAEVISGREAAITQLIEVFEAEERGHESMTFGIETGFEPREMSALEEHFNRNSNGPFMSNDDPFQVARCRADPTSFMAALRTGEQRLKASHNPQDVAEAVLAATPKVLFWAKIEGDRIGGFKSSSMSPGKQALFALELILGGTDEPWPLLIDQPEDDLDSRSISTQLVSYLTERKTERQIIMVSHDANLVVGADAEQIVVANRHGDNTKNAAGRTFDYFSGSLEHTRPRREEEVELESGGIREHACDILDGGEEAFRKRRRKYKIA